MMGGGGGPGVVGGGPLQPAPPLPVNEVPDYLRLGVAPTNFGVNDENVPRIPQHITSQQIRHNIALTYAGQYTDRVAGNVGSTSTLFLP